MIRLIFTLLAIIALVVIINLYLFFFGGKIVEPASIELPNVTKTYYKDDVSFVTRDGIMVFIPQNSITKNGKMYTGDLQIHTATNQQFRKTLPATTRRVVHDIQNPGKLFQLNTKKGEKTQLGLNNLDAMEVVVLVPTLPNDTNRQLLWHPEELLDKGFPNGFLRLNKMRDFFNDKNEKQLLSEIIRLQTSGHAPSNKKIQKIERYLSKLESEKQLANFLQSSWQIAQTKFKKHHPDYQAEGDLTSDIPFFATSISYLHNTITGDSTLFKIFERYTNELKESLVIIDWTGSMYGFKGDVTAIIKHLEAAHLLKYLVLFNDKYYYKTSAGIGDFGGIYHTDPTKPYPSFDITEKLMDKCRSESDGGDLRENDLEAIVKAQKMYPIDSFQSIVLVADNSAKPKDMPLLNQVEVPVIVVACRARTVEDVLDSYKQIAAKNGGFLLLENGERLDFNIP